MNKTDHRISEYLGHIIDAIERIDRYTMDMTKEQFLGDEKTQDAVVRNFEIIGEACNNITKRYAEFAAQHSEIPWGVLTKCVMPCRMDTIK